MSDIGFGPVGDPPIIHGGNSYVTRDGYGRPTYLVDRRLLEKAEARIAELEEQLRPMSPLRQQADTYLRILRHPEIYRHLREGAGSWSDQIDARITTLAADRDHWRAEAEKARTRFDRQAGRHRQAREIAEEALDRGALNVPALARLIRDVLEADRLESEATADDVVEQAAQFTAEQVRDAVVEVLDQNAVSLWLPYGDAPHGNLHPEDVGHVARWVVEALLRGDR